MKKNSEAQEISVNSDKKRSIDWIIFGRNVHKYRKRKHLTQQQLAELCGMKPNSISRIEQGAAGTKLVVLLLLSDALEVSPDALLQGNFKVQNYRYADHFLSLRDELNDRLTETVDKLFDAEAKRRHTDTFEDRRRVAEHIDDPIMRPVENPPTADPNLPEKNNRRRPPHDRG